ncbi:hypothetical protein ACFP2T_47815 [Plantactinospora solaniradicis]|uniref:Uncharacterized protein n=1 Tax=Plantactinospora solaniradicis TaxID=1723736 RepID=A0ABW1KTG8_9ACTN
MEKVQRLEKSVVVLIEWIPGEFDAWATLHDAYNVLTNEVMGAGLRPEAIDALEGIVHESYKGWHDDIAARTTRIYLDDLANAGTYDRELVLAYARRTKSETSIEQLKKILDKFEAPRRDPNASPTP